MNFASLYRPEPPWLFVDEIEADKPLLPTFRYASEGVSSVIRVLRGSKMKTRQGLMDEFGAALQFSESFGENWYALRECLYYLDEWLPAEAYILVVTNPLQVLADEPPKELDWLVTTLREVADWWSKPITDNDRFNRSAIPFHTVLQVGPGEPRAAEARFLGAGG